MKFVFGKNDWKTLDRGQENGYLLTNGLGGYSSLTMVGSNSRNDHALFMGCLTAPNHRYHLVSKIEEVGFYGDKKLFDLTCQEYASHAKNKKGFSYLNHFEFEYIPTWVYQVKGIEIKKMIAMAYESNTVGVRYVIENRMKEEFCFRITPQFQFVPKEDKVKENQAFILEENKITSNGIALFFQTNGEVKPYDTKYENDLYYEHDARDGRDSIGRTANNHNIHITVGSNSTEVLDVIYSTENIVATFDEILETEIKRQEALVLQSGIKDSIGQQLVRGGDQFIVNRESTQGKTIMAGYPFFADWGRDTMIAMVGCCITTRRFEEAKDIFRTFMKYCKRGLMPNMFPEGGHEPLYNTVDASLLFIGAVYEYYMESQDLDFVKEAYPVMEEVIYWYKKGTDYHIKMDEDGLIMAGSGLEQVTWMDVRVDGILPTPRHGKPVEINAYWYNDLKVMEYFSKLLQKEEKEYGILAERVAVSFEDKFWNEEGQYLKDVISDSKADNQIRCNQIWAVSQPFSILSKEKEELVVDKVYETLYTPYGLRSLAPEDDEFKPSYGGVVFDRDMAYHQGTVWAFPLGGYYLAYLKVKGYSKDAALKVKEQLSALEGTLREGCIGQIAEIFDGENPTISRGCFAQAWSVSELLRVYGQVEKILGE